MRNGLAVVLIIIFVGIGFAIPVVQLDQFRKNFEIEGLELNDVSVVDSFIGIPTRVKLVFGVSVHNPTFLPFALERMSYSMFINAKFIGDGFTENVLIPSGTTRPIPLPIEISTAGILIGLIDVIGSGTFQLEVKGNMEIPIKFYGIVKLFTISIPFEKSSDTFGTSTSQSMTSGVESDRTFLLALAGIVGLALVGAGIFFRKEISKSLTSAANALTQREQVVKSRFCRQCGASMQPSAGFCQKCGTKVQVMNTEELAGRTKIYD